MNEEARELLLSGARALGVEISGVQMGQFGRYWASLSTWNARINLTAITDEKEVVVKHFLDSMTCLKATDFPNGCRTLDVGSGAGFPGIPLKIVRAGMDLTAMDSVEKKLGFLAHLAGELNLKDFRTIHGRAEDLGRLGVHREQYSRVLARAVANLAVLAEYCLPFCRVDGVVVAMKGPSAEDEVAAAGTAIKILGGRVGEIVEVDLPGDGGARRLIVIEKVRPCPPEYPRRAGVPEKRPLK
jgi:16S rRNA (guanine527-N7)-methyltransferase